MKVLLVNGSPHKNGCTNRALEEVQKQLDKEGIESEIFWIGAEVQGCIGCFSCMETGKCVFDDILSDFVAKAEAADAFVFGSAVYYGSSTGSVSSFMDRLFFSAGKVMQHKPAASVVSCRRGGASMAFSQMNMYYMMSNMPVISSQYWNQVHGMSPDEVEQDAEGLQTMRTLGSNMAWLLKLIELGRKNGLERPELEIPVSTNFIH